VAGHGNGDGGSTMWSMAAKLGFSLRGRPRHAVDEVIRYLLSGAVSAAIDIGGYTLLFRWVGMASLSAAITAQGASILVNYVLNAFWVFRWRRHADIRIELPLFLAVALVGLGIGALVMMVFASYLDLRDERAKVCASAAVACWCFLAKKMWLFAQPKSKGGAVANDVRSSCD
jgi:putative flippase GtrA